MVHSSTEAVCSLLAILVHKTPVIRQSTHQLKLFTASHFCAQNPSYQTVCSSTEADHCFPFLCTKPQSSDSLLINWSWSLLAISVHKTLVIRQSAHPLQLFVHFLQSLCTKPQLSDSPGIDWSCLFTSCNPCAQNRSYQTVQSLTEAVCSLLAIPVVYSL